MADFVANYEDGSIFKRAEAVGGRSCSRANDSLSLLSGAGHWMVTGRHQFVAGYEPYPQAGKNLVSISFLTGDP